MLPSIERIEFVAYGVDVDVDVCLDDAGATVRFPELANAIRDLLPPGAAPRAEGDATPHRIIVACASDSLSVTIGDEVTHVGSDRSLALHAIDQAIRSTIAVAAPGLVFIHAGAVAVGDRAIVLPGRSLAGKTTFVAALVRAGARYLSDEYAVLNDAGLVHPYARRLSVREPTGRREVPIDELGGTIQTAPVSVGLVAAVEFHPDAHWEVEPADQGACARALIANAVAAQIRPQEVLAVSAVVARGAPFIEGIRGDVSDAVDHLLEALHP